MTESRIDSKMDEAEYRKKIQSTLDRIERAFEEIDPDVVECEQSFGSLTIKLGDGSRCILSAQPSVRQLWMALASRGTAYHFDLDPQNDQWIDDKGKGLEILSFLHSFIKESTQLDIKF